MMGASLPPIRSRRSRVAPSTAGPGATHLAIAVVRFFAGCRKFNVGRRV